MAVSSTDVDAIAAEAMSVLGTDRQVVLFSARFPEFALADAYQVTATVQRLRAARGETPVGRKIGFTNRRTWPDYPPMWGYVYDRTVHDLAAIEATFALTGLAEPRLEPEVAFRLAGTPAPEMDDHALLACIEAVAPSFEVVQSIFPGWRFTAPDAVAAFGLHGALLLGPWRPVAGNAAMWQQMLATCTVDLHCDGTLVDHGQAANVLGGPLPALRHLVGLLARDPVNPPLAAGDLVTTGTLTRVPPVQPGERWTTRLAGIALDDLAVRFG